ncbi:MAG: hypothetical protein PHO62_07755 [Sulfurimonas sp.]|uniref:hypothetical protein n=1 Tax=Sulfurimonas sp. TaxID=2022749 RepID=UPI002620C180|nr:hypothetical protein [Sulfurimonas sp.]MDD5373301.1 hypothetical protein [Sulfurimonas sp.]
MRRELFFLLLCGLSLHAAIGGQETPGVDYKLQVGLGNENKASGVVDKNSSVNLPRSIQIPKNTVNEVKKPETDFTDAFILYQIQNANRRPQTKPSADGDLMALPTRYEKELVAYNKATASANAGVGGAVKAKESRLLFMRCETAQDYKINTDTTLKMFCKDLKSPDMRYRLNASLQIKNRDLVSTPYLIEFESGEIYSVEQDKSRLFNATNGSLNLATYVNKRALDKTEQGMATALATDAPALAKDYLAQKNKADQELVQSNNGLNSTITQSTKNPKPEAGDYGIALLVSVLSGGLKSGVDQLYLDLGYIYYIPRDTVIEAEIVIKVGE